MYTNDKRNFGYFLLLLALFLLSTTGCRDNKSYITDPQGVIEQQPVNKATAQGIPLAVRKYYDDTGAKKCENIPDIFFSKAAPFFNPGFYRGVLWLDIFFPDTTEKLGQEYILDFGAEPLDFAEVFIQKGNSWELYGRTGRMLKQSQITSPSWRQYVPINEAVLDKAIVHHIRIKLMAHIGSPVNIRFVPRRAYNVQTSWFSMVCYLVGGLFLVAILFIFVYGLVFKDPVYRVLSGSALFFFLTEVELKGTGPVFLWNFLAPLKYSQRITYVFADITFLYLIATFLFIAHENVKRVKGKGLVYALASLLTVSLISCFTVSSPVIAFYSTSGAILLSCVLFYILLRMNTISNRKDIHLLPLHWRIMCIIVLIRQSFHILRIYFPQPIFTVFDNDLYVTFYVLFLLIVMPAIYITGRRLKRRFVLLQARTQAAAKQISRRNEEYHFFFLLTQELFNQQNVIQNAAMLPLTADSNSNKETHSLIMRTAARSVDLLNALNYLERGYADDEKAILLADFFNSCIHSVEPFANNRGISFTVTEACSDDCIVSANSKLLELMISDMLLAVVSRTPLGTKVKVTLKNDDNKFIYLIKNEEKESERHALQEDEKTNFIFTLIERVALLYNGSLLIEPRSEATTYTLTLKLNQISEIDANTPVLLEATRDWFVKGSADNDKKAPIISDKLLAPDGKIPIILLVENSKENAELLSNALDKHSMLRKTINGLEAWNMLNSYNTQSKLPDVIICEYNLPLLSGAELFRKCKQEPSLQDIPFIFLVSVSEYAKRSEIINKGAAGCLLKPFNFNDLFNEIYEILNIQGMANHAFLSKISNIVQVMPAVQEEHVTQAPVKSEPVKMQASVPQSISLTPTQQALFASVSLSQREQAIAIRISEGKSDKQIASEFNISAGTVATHNKSIFKKLGVHSRVELTNKVR